jgi:hypothetical protein
MTMGTATVARTRVRTIGPRSASHGPTVRFSTVSVGKTAIQIIRASWCFVGGLIWRVESDAREVGVVVFIFWLLSSLA